VPSCSLPRLQEDLRKTRAQQAEERDRFKARIGKLRARTLGRLRQQQKAEAASDKADQPPEACNALALASCSSKHAASVRETQDEFRAEHKAFSEALKEALPFQEPPLARHRDGTVMAGPHLGWSRSRQASRNNAGWFLDPQVTRRKVMYNQAVNAFTKDLANDEHGLLQKVLAWIEQGDVTDIDAALTRHVQETWAQLAKACNNLKSANGQDLAAQEIRTGQAQPWAPAYGDRSYLLRVIPEPDAQQVQHIVRLVSSFLHSHSTAYCELQGCRLPAGLLGCM